MGLQQLQHKQMVRMRTTPRHCSQEDDDQREQRQWKRFGQNAPRVPMLGPEHYGMIKERASFGPRRSIQRGQEVPL